ncbi:LysR family transcriptional regulator, partial [Escherichia coli]|nr:LysR family transcriptional regulator [Escherichia coli]
QEHFYAITTRHRHRIEVLETLLERSSGRMGPS